MKKIKNRVEGILAQRKAVDLVGIDFSTTATKVVRLKKSRDEISLMGIDLLPAVDFGIAAQRVELPRNLASHYACLVYSGASSIVRMVNAQLPAETTTLPDKKLRELLNAKDDCRVSARLIKKGQRRQDSNFLAVAIPKADVEFLLNLFPVGSPAPASVEVAGLSFVSAFLHAQAAEAENDAVCLVEAGESSSHFVFLNKGVVVLVGRFDSGGAKMRGKVAKDLGVDDELANTIMADRSINISSVVLDVMTPFLKQLSISKDFIERHQSCHVSKIYVSGGMSLLPHWTEMLEQYLHTEIVHWNAFENISCDPELLPPELAQQTTRFTAVIGAVIGGIGEL
jgi:Tfp pilus assembly PilM family ATPase